MTIQSAVATSEAPVGERGEGADDPDREEDDREIDPGPGAEEGRRFVLPRRAAEVRRKGAHSFDPEEGLKPRELTPAPDVPEARTPSARARARAATSRGARRGGETRGSGAPPPRREGTAGIRGPIRPSRPRAF